MQKECASQSKHIKALNQKRLIAEHSVKFLEEEMHQQKLDCYKLKRSLEHQIYCNHAQATDNTI